MSMPCPRHVLVVCVHLMSVVCPSHVRGGFRVREYMVDLEKKIAKAGSKVLRLDEDGNVTTTAGPTSSDNAMTK